MVRWLSGLLVCAMLCAVSAPARAEEDRTPRLESNRIGLHSEYWKWQGLGTLSSSLTAQYRALPHLMIDLDIPGALSINRGGVLSFLGNPTLGARWVNRASPKVAYGVGLSVTFPMQRNAIDFPEGIVRLLAALSRAGVDLQRFVPQTYFFRVPLQLEVRLVPELVYRGEVTPLLWSRTGDNNDPVQLNLEHVSEIEWQTASRVVAGLRLQALFALTDKAWLAPNDRVQAALEPFVGYEPRGTGFYARLGVLLALNKPFGTAQMDDAALTSFRLNVGAAF